MDTPSRRRLRHLSHTTRHNIMSDGPKKSRATATATATVDDAAMGSTLANEQLLREAQNSQLRSELEKYEYGALAQLSFAPATQTTVVTTTTTTTTQLPPLIMKPPPSLHDRDPKHFPLARCPTPQALRQLSFDYHGRPAYFRETDDMDGALDKYTQHQSQLAASNGVIQSVISGNVTYDTPEQHSTQSSTLLLPCSQVSASSPSGPGRRKRAVQVSPTPPSLAEAAEIAGIQRRYKRTRSGLHRSNLSIDSLDTDERSKGPAYMEDNGPATPDTDAGSFMPPPIGNGACRSSLGSSKNASTSSSDGDARLKTRSSLAPRVNGALSYASSSSSRPPPAGVAATPPIVEGDLDRLGPFDNDDNVPYSQASRRPPQLHLIVAQDSNASLPSPSLSPITAAATFANVVDNQDLEDEDNEVSSLDISQDALEEQTLKSLIRRRATGELQLNVPQETTSGSANPQLPTPSLMDMPVMFDSFDSMPPEMQKYVIFQMLRRCNKPTLQFVADVVNPSLKCDFLDMLPIELSLSVAKYLDAKSMCRAAQVSRKWREILDSDEAAWKDLLDDDGFELPQGEVERAIREGWGWQFPHGCDNGEEDLSHLASSQQRSAYPNIEDSPRSVASSLADSDAVPLSTSGRPKRKANRSGGGGNKRQKRKAPTSRHQIAQFAAPLTNVQGPIAHANEARRAIPDAEIGIASLRNMHLYKSLYRRHFLIRKAWMQQDVKPRHIAFRAHQRHVVTCLQFDTDKILTGSDDTKINVYDTKTGAKRRVLEGHEGGVWALEYEGNMLVSGSTDRSVRVWDIETGRCLHTFQGHTSTVRCLVILKPTKIGEHADGSPIMMPKQPLIITGSRDSTLRVWKLPWIGDKSIHQTGPPSNDYDNPFFVRALTGHQHSVRAIAAHGDTLVSGSYDCTVRVWKISTGETQHRLAGHTQKVYSVVLDHERHRCISGSMDNLVKVWSLELGTCLFNLEGHQSLVGLLDLSHDRLVSAAADSTLRIWEPDNGQCKATLSAHTGAITCFQHDDQKVISGSDRTLKMWNVKTGECVKDLLTDLSGVWQVRFNERRCVAAVQRNNLTFIEVLDFGASRDGVARERRGVRIVVDKDGRETPAPASMDVVQVHVDASARMD